MVKNLTKFTISFVVLSIFTMVGLGFLWTQSVHSEEYIKLPPDSWHQSFAPYENPIHIPSAKPKGVTVRVTEIMTYEVVVDEKKLVPNTLTMEDLELIEVHDKNKINFHQVDCYFYAKVKQTQTRKTDYISSMRWREGQQYWLSDGGKYVEWEPWTQWYDDRKKW